MRVRFESRHPRATDLCKLAERRLRQRLRLHHHER